MKEVAGNAAILVDPTKPEDIRKGYDAMKMQAEVLVKLGVENVKRFALDKITQQYLEVYKSIVK